MVRQPYPSDLSDAEWALLETQLVVTGGRPLKYSLREIANAVFYRLRTGCQWRYLPHDFPPWKNVYYHVTISKKLAAWVAKHLCWEVEVVRRPREWVRCPPGVEPPPLPAGTHRATRFGCRWMLPLRAPLGRRRRVRRWMRGAALP